MADPSAKQTGQKSVKIAAGAVVCVESDIRGDVTIGARTVVHPKARIIAEAGPIVIGEGNLIEEQALIINSFPENLLPNTDDVEPKPMIIGVNNVFEVGCVSQALKIGDNNVIESKGQSSVCCVHNADGDECVHNADGDECVHNADGDECVRNADGDECVRNADGDECVRNADGDECVQ
ncbi:dynactin subunit 6 [Danio aesculapii]|uniref:dynactin subunit 6 n=1 Tax=Danio aesculapii TaxID=1142201 RepID=UPI0024BF765D|nr:dynactin subunit 6 [Danio aesculapii]